MPNLLNDQSFPNPTQAPELRSATVRTCGCLAIVGAFLATLAVVVIVVGFTLVRNEMQRRAEADRIAAEMQAAESAALQAKYAKENAERMEKAALLQAENERKAAELAELRQQKLINELKAQREREAVQARLQAKMEEAERAVRERISEESRLLENLRHIVNGRQNFLAQNRERLLMPNGGGESKLSWRVHLLPYMGHRQLYERFKLNEPWDSEHNLRLIKSMPIEFGKSEEGKTRFRSLLNVDGEGAPFLHDYEVLDGLEQTALVVCFGRDQAIEWTRPDDLEDQSQTDLLFKSWEQAAKSDVTTGITSSQLCRGVIMCDNRFKTWPENGTAPHLKAIATPNQCELICFTDLNGEILTIREVLEVPAQPIKEQPINEQPNEQANEQEKAKQQLSTISQALQAFRTALAKNPSLGQQHPQLSCRVHLLPYLGAEDLYKKFNLNEAWDSPNNFALLPEMPQVYRFGSSLGRTRFCLSSFSKREQISEFQLSQLIDPNLDDPNLTPVLYFTAPHISNYWTRPDPYVLQPHDNISTALGWNKDHSVTAFTLSGNPIALPGNLHSSKVTALISWFGKEVFDLDAALAEPEKRLHVKVNSQPATPIAGLISLPAEAQAIKLSTEPTVSPTAQDQARLQKLALAILNFESAFRKSPTQLKTSTGLVSGLSWRVHILPYLDQVALYEKFVLDEPWDSPANIEAAKTMPAIFGSSQTNKTDVLTFKGKGAILDAKNWMASCTDGLNNTIMLVQVPEHRLVPWTKPDDIELDESLEIGKLADKQPTLLVALGDGLIMPLATKLPNAVFVAMTTSNGNELIDAATVRRLSLNMLGQPHCSILQKPMLESNRLKNIGLAMHNYESAMKIFPPGRGFNSNGAPPPETYCLSWRVHILPFLGYQALYSQFRLNEPWDSWHNKQLINLMPDVFRDEEDASNSNTTRIQVAMGAGTAFREIGDAPKFQSITDGPSNTLMVLIAPKSRAVPWTQPSDYEVDLAKADFKEFRTNEGLPFATFDGAVYRAAPDFDSEKLKALITPSGGEVIDVTQLQK